MAKTIRMHQINKAAEKKFSPKLLRLSEKVARLEKKLNTLERQMSVKETKEVKMLEVEG